MKNIWSKIDGWKTLSGVAVAGIGFLCTLSPITAPMAGETIRTGIGITIGGLIHKGQKAIKKHKLNKSKGD